LADRIRARLSVRSLHPFMDALRQVRSKADCHHGIVPSGRPAPPVIQDAADPRSRIVGVVDRRGFDAGIDAKMIWIPLPDDFGKPAYGARRAEAIDNHLSAMTCEPRELRRLFDLLLGPSGDIEMLRYLIEDYWGRRAGWPDLLVYRDHEFFFAEVKSVNDKLGKSQERWIRDNRE
jgi:VRR-NUC domain-containing protein